MSVFEEWLRLYGSKATRANYTSGMRAFFRMLHGLPDEPFPVAPYADIWIKKDQEDLKKDVMNFWIHLSEIGVAPKTASVRLTAIRTFLEDNEIEFSKAFWKKKRKRWKGKPRARHKDVKPNAKMLRKIFEHLEIRFRALFSCQASSGARIGEILALESKDLNLDAIPPRAYLRAEVTKNGKGRIIFFTQEAKETLLEWRKVREEHMQKVYAKTKHSLIFRFSLDDPRIFPFDSSVAHNAWRNALKDAGLFELDPYTGWVTIRPHVLRKRFRSDLATVIPVDVVEQFLGHEGYETEEYRLRSEEELAEFYLQGEYILYLSSDRAEVEKIHRDVERQRKIMDEEFLDMKREMAELKSELAKITMKGGG